MKRKDYEEPTIKVVELQHRTMLLAGSTVESGSAGVENYGWNTPSEE